VVSQPMRIAVLTLSGLLAAGLIVLGVIQYRADQRAVHQAARPEASVPHTTKLETVQTGQSPQPGAPSSDGAQPPEAKKEIQVHVAGAVQNPGVYRLPAGARVAEAITAAGGKLPDGEPDELNLAEPLTDGAKVHIPTAAEVKAAAVAPAPPAPKGTVQVVRSTVGTAKTGSTKAPGGQVHLNTATASELESLPGIGASTAAKIIAYRNAHGPFQRVEDLTKVSGIGAKTLEKFRDSVTL
jgi:competence protein ComEA